MARTLTGATDPYRAALRSLRPALVLAGIFSAAINILMLTGPLYMLQVYDRVLGSGSVPTLVALSAVVLLLYGFFGLYEFLRARILSRAGTKLDVLAGPGAFGDWIGRTGTASPQVLAQPLRDLDTVRGFLGSPAVHGLFDVPWIPLYLIIAFAIHPLLGVLTLAGAGVVIAVALITRHATEGAIGHNHAAEAAERAFADQALRNAELIAAHGMGNRITERWRGLRHAALATGQTGGDRSEIAAAFSKTFRLLLQSALLTAGAWLAIGQEISAGMIVASSIIAGRALAPVDQVIGQWRSIGRAHEAHRRLLAAGAARKSAPARITLPDPTGALRVSGLTKFAPGFNAGANADGPRILDRVSFELSPGDGLGVIGNSASGKSTLARLLTGAWIADAGEIRLDGATPDQWAPEALGRHIGYLPQTVEMLPGTIRDNIARFDPAARDDAVIEAARIAGVHDMILRLPEGYATAIGPGRMPLSGGQVQRLGLARALYGKPKLIVLDEPNANLDATGDDALAAAIARMRAEGSVVIVMAHRPSAIAEVNKIMILHNGQVAQFGAKKDVMQPSTRGVTALSTATPHGPRAAAAPATILAADPTADPTLATAVAAEPPAPAAASASAPSTGDIPGWPADPAPASPPPASLSSSLPASLRARMAK